MSRITNDELNAFALYRTTPVINIFSLTRLLAKELDIDEKLMETKVVELFEKLKEKVYDKDGEK